MEHIISILPLFTVLIICVLNGYCMCSYRLPTKQAFLWFLAVTLFCLALNSYIIIFHSLALFHGLILFTVALPYFFMILFISKDKISQTFFNFWLWINIYTIITTISLFINDILLRNRGFEITLRILLFIGYLFLYQRVLKKPHRLIIEQLNINWWGFSLVPMLFSVLIYLTNQLCKVPSGFSRNYLMLLTIYVLMVFVYLIVGYIFQTSRTSLKLKLTQAALCQQLDAAQEQIAFLNESQVQTAIYRHNLRHHLTAIDGFLSTDRPEQAREYIKKVESDVEAITPRRFCENELVNLLCSSFSDKAERIGARLTINATLPQNLSVSDTELCSILSNGLENALRAVAQLEKSRQWVELYCDIRMNKLLIEIRNPYEGEVLLRDGLPVSQREGHGYGCHSIRTIAQQHKGLCAFEPQNGVFTLRVVLPVRV